MDNFEDEIKIAFNRIKRSELKAKLQEHEEVTFDADTTVAFKRLERERLKASLNAHAEIQNTIKIDKNTQFSGLWKYAANAHAENQNTIKIDKNTQFSGLWKYAAAACVIIGIGVFAYFESNKYTNQFAINKAKNSEPKDQVAINKPKTKDYSKKDKPSETVAKDQVINTSITPVVIGEMGFGIQNIAYSLILNSGFKDIQYSLVNEKLTIKAGKELNIKIYKIQGDLYLGLNKKVFYLKQTPTFTPIKEVKDEDVLFLIQ
jgi:hypothetical protein